MQKPLPPDYARPTLADYLAASKTHTTDGYLPFVQGHEAELRKHYVAPAPEAAVSSEPDPVLVLELEPDAPAEPVHYFNPRDAMAASSELAELDEALTVPFNPRAELAQAPAPFVRPTVEEWQAAGYGKELTGAELDAAHKKFFDDYEAELLAKTSAAGSASGELSPSA